MLLTRTLRAVGSTAASGGPPSLTANRRALWRPTNANANSDFGRPAVLETVVAAIFFRVFPSCGPV